MLRLSEGVPSEIDDRFRKTPPESFFPSRTDYN